MALARSAAIRFTIASLVLSAGLLLVGWYDYASTRRELLTLLIDQAVSLRQAVAAAARSGEAASAQTHATLSARLLDNARLLNEIDRLRGLSQGLLDEIVRTNRLFRVTVFTSAGQREFASGSGGPPPGAGRGFGAGPGGGRGFGPGPGAGGDFGPGAGGGMGAGRGRGAEIGGGASAGAGGGGVGIGALADRLLTGGEQEAVSDVHGSRWGRGWRLAAGVRRARGGAIVLNVDAGEVAELSRQASIEHLLEDIATGAAEIVYVVLEDGSNRLAYGPLADPAKATTAPAGSSFTAVDLPRALEGLTANELEVAGVRVLEFGGAVDAAKAGSPNLRLGLNLEGLRRAERRTLTRLVLSLVAALALGVVMIAFLFLRREYGELSRKHASAEAALRRRDRLAAMGELASTVAHEVRNPLNAIGMSAQRLRREFLAAGGPAAPQDQAELRELLDVLASETQRIDRIVRQFLEYARPPTLAPRRVNLGDLVSASAAGLRDLAATRNIAIGLDVSAASDAVVDPDQLKQALDNLVRNAIEASPDGARVDVRARDDAASRVIEVEDRGPGIPANLLPKIFDLYFTTKADGTGVGLAVTHQIVEAHDGAIEVDSVFGRGTRMIVTLPGTHEEAPRG